MAARFSLSQKVKTPVLEARGFSGKSDGYGHRRPFIHSKPPKPNCQRFARRQRGGLQLLACRLPHVDPGSIAGIHGARA